MTPPETLADADARSEASERRRSARAEAREKHRQTPQDFKRAQKTPVPGTPEALVESVRAAAARELAEARARETAPPPDVSAVEPFSIVAAPPASAGPTPIPDVRRRAQSHARENPGRWIRYPSNPEDPYRRAVSIASHIREGVSGFAPAGSFEYCTRQNVLYFRYLGEGHQS